MPFNRVGCRNLGTRVEQEAVIFLYDLYSTVCLCDLHILSTLRNKIKCVNNIGNKVKKNIFAI